jgi:ABC-type multidrug transport system ATPase subunit
MQDDRLVEEFTVKESIEFAANLKLDKSSEEKRKIVEKLIKELKLEKCQHTFIGGHFKKGISGGERRRTSIGFELVSNPKVIFLDEPTSGLDSFTSFLLIKILKTIALTHSSTVILTIHQPSSEIWAIFDKIMILAKGNFIY